MFGEVFMCYLCEVLCGFGLVIVFIVMIYVLISYLLIFVVK